METPEPVSAEGQSLGHEAPVAHKAGGETPQTTSDLNSLRVKVAELRGAEWHDAPPSRIEGASLWPKRVLAFKKPNFDRAPMPIAGLNGDAFWHDVHNYPSDLNAIQEAIQTMRGKPEFDEFIDLMLANCGVSSAITATAEQRCLAFVAVMEASRPKAADSVVKGNDENLALPGKQNPSVGAAPLQGMEQERLKAKRAFDEHVKTCPQCSGCDDGCEEGQILEERALGIPETDVNAGRASKQKWLPIESAPKDGTVIDLWCKSGGRWSDCYWGKPSHSCGEAGEYCDSDWHGAEPGWVYSTFNEFLEASPTYWMPLPSVPDANDAGAATSLPAEGEKFVPPIGETDEEIAREASLQLFHPFSHENGITNTQIILTAIQKSKKVQPSNATQGTEKKSLE